MYGEMILDNIAKTIEKILFNKCFGEMKYPPTKEWNRTLILHLYHIQNQLKMDQRPETIKLLEKKKYKEKDLQH